MSTFAKRKRNGHQSINGKVDTKIVKIEMASDVSNITA